MSIDRREFFRHAARGVALAVLGAGGSVLGRRTVRAGNDACTGGGVCGRCPVNTRCALPAALSRRRVLGEER